MKPWIVFNGTEIYAENSLNHNLLYEWWMIIFILRSRSNYVNWNRGNSIVVNSSLISRQKCTVNSIYFRNSSTLVRYISARSPKNEKSPHLWVVCRKIWEACRIVDMRNHWHISMRDIQKAYRWHFRGYRLCSTLCSSCIFVEMGR